MRFPITGSNAALKGGDRISATAVDFLRDDDAEFPSQQVVVKSSEVVRNGQAVEVVLCIDPGRPMRVKAGKYTGTLIIDDPRIEEKAVTVTISLQDGLWWPLLAVPLGALGGVLWAWGAAQVAGTQAEEEKAKRISTGKLKFELVIALLVATGVGVGVYFNKYWADPSWSLDLKSWWALALLVGAAAAVAYPPAAAAARAIHARLGSS